jgi:hypothetical protein
LPHVTTSSSMFVITRSVCRVLPLTTINQWNDTQMHFTRKVCDDLLESSSFCDTDVTCHRLPNGKCIQPAS